MEEKKEMGIKSNVEEKPVREAELRDTSTLKRGTIRAKESSFIYIRRSGQDVLPN
jgi:hypothetical protein